MKSVKPTVFENANLNPTVSSANTVKRLQSPQRLYIDKYFDMIIE